MNEYNKFNSIAFKLLSEMSGDKDNPHNYLVLENDEGTENTDKTPLKMEAIFIKEMKPYFKQGESVDVVKEGKSFKIFSKRAGSNAHGIDFNEAKAKEFFGERMVEGWFSNLKKKTSAAVGAGLSGAGGKITSGGGVIDALKAAKIAGEKALQEVGAQQKYDSAKEKIINIVKTLGGSINKVPPDKIDSSIDTALKILIGGKSFKLGSKPASPSSEKEKEPQINNPASTPDTDSPEFSRTEEEISEDTNKLPKGIPQAKFIDKSASKPKKAKKLGAFRGGKVGSGTSAPKE